MAIGAQMKMVHKLRNADYMTKVLYSYNILYFIFFAARIDSYFRE